MQLLDLPAPLVVEVFDFETIRERKLARVIEIAKSKDIEYIPHESDDLVTMVEADAYEEMLLRTRMNNGVKAQLLSFAEGSDLEHISATRYGVTRLDGESDERFRERVWLSRERKSTAGSVLTYKYYATTADIRVVDVEVISESDGVVDVYLLSSEGVADDEMISRVDAMLSDESVRPLTDDVNVHSATLINATIEAEITLYDKSYESNVKALIEGRIKENTLIFGKTLTLSKIYGLLESEMVKDVTLAQPTATIECKRNEVIDVTTLTLNFSEAL